MEPRKIHLHTFWAVIQARQDACEKAWNSLGRYKFEMFGYHASAWVKYNALLPVEQKLPNPFRELVGQARDRGFGPQPGDAS